MPNLTTEEQQTQAALVKVVIAGKDSGPFQYPGNFKAYLAELNKRFDKLNSAGEYDVKEFSKFKADVISCLEKITPHSLLKDTLVPPDLAKSESGRAMIKTYDECIKNVKNSTTPFELAVHLFSADVKIKQLREEKTTYAETTSYNVIPVKDKFAYTDWHSCFIYACNLTLSLFKNNGQLDPAAEAQFKATHEPAVSSSKTEQPRTQGP